MTLLGDLIIDDSPGFACSKSKLTEGGLLHLRPFNIGADGRLDTTQTYRIPESEAPEGKRALQAGDLLFNNTNSIELVGKTALVERDMVAGFSNHLTRLRVDRLKIEPEYLLYYLRRLWQSGLFAARATRWVSQAAFKSEQLRRITLTVPSLTEQRGIVDILSRAEGIIRLQRQATEKVREIIPVLFLDMFGDPMTNPKNWPSSLLSELAEVVSGVTKGRRLNKRSTVTVPYLRVANVQGGMLDLSEIKTIEATPDEVNRLALRYGDVLLTEGGDYDKLGRGAMWKYDVPDCIHQNHVFRVRADVRRMLPEFFEAYLQTRFAKAYFLRSAKRTTNLASINMTQLRALPVFVPPVSLQGQFASTVRSLDGIAGRQQRSDTTSEDLFGSLLYRAFNDRL